MVYGLRKKKTKRKGKKRKKKYLIDEVYANVPKGMY